MHHFNPDVSSTDHRIKKNWYKGAKLEKNFHIHWAKFPAKEQRSKAAKTFFEIIKENKGARVEKIVLNNII
ncbi:hypothetical protein CTE07_18670 [Chitinophaga terrae (ex Kim and Jung 2007)]|nr:hypothetical protein CTE07_18670 [Chitinophaga terrae (ex Kim and Jung 2007)]